MDEIKLSHIEQRNENGARSQDVRDLVAEVRRLRVLLSSSPESGDFVPKADMTLFGVPVIAGRGYVIKADSA